jgi:F420-0:gamma-glutamyl ligase
VAVAVAGFEPVRDERGRRDLYGNPLRVTRRALADDLAAAAQLLMGEADEATPIVVARGAGVVLTDRPISPEELAVPPGECLYVRTLASEGLWRREGWATGCS